VRYEPAGYNTPSRTSRRASKPRPLMQHGDMGPELPPNARTYQRIGWLTVRPSGAITQHKRSNDTTRRLSAGHHAGVTRPPSWVWVFCGCGCFCAVNYGSQLL
jgi:hypothetical protein